MDRALDEVIGERQQRGGGRGRRERRRDDWPRDGPRKSARDAPRDLNSDWVHDKFEDDNDNYRRPAARGRRSQRTDRYSPEREVDTQAGAKVRIENLHWDLTEEDLENLFTRIGPVKSVKILYDRAGRSEGVAFVVYESASDARVAVDEYSGANANGQPIYLKLVPNTSRGTGAGTRNPFDTVQKPARSLFDRVTSPSGSGGRRRRDDRSASPDRPRRSDVTKPAPGNIDRYVPGQGQGQGQRRSSRSPIRRRGGRGRGGGGRRGDAERNEGPRSGQGRRPRKTQEELDAEMDDYWGGKEEAPVAAGSAGEATQAQNGGVVEVANTIAPPAAAAGAGDGDIDMIE